MVSNFKGRRVLVVGASAGIGRAIAVGAVRSGAEVVFSARRHDALLSAVEEAGGGIAIVGNMRIGDDCRRVVDEAVAALGGLDLVVYSTGISPFRPADCETAESLCEVYETNTMGALLVLIAATRYVDETGILAYIGSESVGHPYPGLVAYAASKAGLDEGVDALRSEYPNHRFCRVSVGTTMGTEIGAGYTREARERLIPDVLRNGLIGERTMDAKDLGALIVELLAPALAHPDTEVEQILIRPPGGKIPWGTPIEMLLGEP